MSSLPFPVRVAAGLVVTAVEEARDLPRTVAGLPITAVSRVLQMSMRAQQMVTELAIKGDTALDGMPPVEEAPSWARFDDEPGTGSGPAGRTSVFDRTPSGDPSDTGWDATIDDTSMEYSALDDTPVRVHGVNGHASAEQLDGSPATGAVDDAPTPDALPGYEDLTIAQLRGRLRTLSLDQVTELLAWESAHADRPPFVTMLSNRITTLTAGR